MAASVLLNFAGGVDFTPTDPLLCLVRTGGQLLSYDRLSVGRFPDVGKEEERKGFIQSKAAELRNILEDRSLSSQDQGERIRVIVLLDFKPWGFLKPQKSEEGAAFDTAFPSLKVDFVRSRIETVFGSRNPLLQRLDYIFIFVDDTLDKARSSLYRSAAFHGYYYKGSSSDDWIPSSFGLDRKRDEVLAGMKAPDASSSLEAPPVKAGYKVFLAERDRVFGQIVHYLKQLEKDEAFLKEAGELFGLKTVEDFQRKHFDDDLKSLITSLCGLGAGRFSDCTFFVLNLNPSYVAQKSRGGITLKSLVQLLCTVDDGQFRPLFGPGGPQEIQKFFIVEDSEDDDIRIRQLLEYDRDIALLGSQVVGMKWDPDKEVEYTEFTSPEGDVEGSHKSQNATIDEEGNKNEKDFREKRKIPFFFGIKPGDWKWFHSVMESLDKCLTFEEENDRPIVDRLTRLDDDMLNKRTIKTNFGELGTNIENSAPAEIVSEVDYDRYIRDRKDMLTKLGEKARILSDELKKLGVRSCSLWMLFLACLAFTVCFAFHFFSPTSANDHPLWISAGFLAAGLIMVLAAIIAQIVVSRKIRATYLEIDKLLGKMKERSAEHLQSISKLARAMNEADAHRKTLSEMKSKYNEWNQHNKKVENWISFTQDITTWLDTLFSDLNIARKSLDEDVELHLQDTLLAGKPSVIVQIRTRYNNMPTAFIVNNTQQNTVHGATCFVSSFNVKRIQ